MNGEKTRVQFQLQIVSESARKKIDRGHVNAKQQGKLYMLEAELCDSIPELPLTYEFCNAPIQFKSAVKILNVPFFVENTVLYTALKSAKNSTTDAKWKRELNVNEANFSYVNHTFKIFPDSSDLTGRTKFVVFALEEGATECLNYLESIGRSYSEHLMFKENEIEGGTSYFCRQYWEQFPMDPQEMKKKVSDWLQKFSQREENEKLAMKEEVTKMRDGVNKLVGNDEGENDDDDMTNGDADDDGWTIVGRYGKRKITQGGNAFTHQNQEGARQKMAKGGHKKQILNFYAHHLQTKKEKGEKELRERFERDKLVVARMKSANRKFNPGLK